MSNKDISTIIHEMRLVAATTIRAAGEGTLLNLAFLTELIDSWRFGLEEAKQAMEGSEEE